MSNFWDTHHSSLEFSSQVFRSRVQYYTMNTSVDQRGRPPLIYFSSSARCGSTYETPVGRFARFLWTEVTSALRFFARERVRALLTMRCYRHFHATLLFVSHEGPEVRCNTTF